MALLTGYGVQATGALLNPISGTVQETSWLTSWPFRVQWDHLWHAPFPSLSVQTHHTKSVFSLLLITLLVICLLSFLSGRLLFILQSPVHHALAMTSMPHSVSLDCVLLSLGGISTFCYYRWLSTKRDYGLRHRPMGERTSWLWLCGWRSVNTVTAQVSVTCFRIVYSKKIDTWKSFTASYPTLRDAKSRHLHSS